MTQYEEKLENIKKKRPDIVEYLQEPPIQIAAICLRLGLKIESKQMGFSGSISYDEIDQKFIISVNEVDTLENRRFTVAHELSHYFLHKDKIKEKSVLYDEPLKRDENYNYSHLERPDEIAANNLAAELLMPRKQLRQRYDELLALFGQSEKDYMAKLLASEYAVSVLAMRIRLGL